ncbi:hypothetical protein EV421DRAFT_2013888 [Armillaria borealis]|uniref:Uncharacterized protein n=1 Tax=Armillaria borealis TaxID=47425 RepID=A0AA39K931_9AGAR|nr:hypothetical protein EV421DRAFT_2013888 [Armillaria borealis]
MARRGESADEDDDHFERWRVKKVWSGVLGISADGLPWRREWITAGYSGEGMVHAWMSGKALVYMEKTLDGSLRHFASQKKDGKRQILGFPDAPDIEDKEKGGKMAVCSRCTSIGREIRYCKLAVVTAKWPIGGSRKQHQKARRAHLVIRRSLHIVQLIGDLELNMAKHDYVVDTTPSKSDNVFALASKGLFRVLRTHAQDGSRVRSAREQLMREYGEPLWNRMQALVRRGLPFSVPEVSRKDVDTIIKAFKELKHFTHILSVVGQRDICVIVRFPEDATPPPCIPVPTPNPAPTLPAWNAVGPNFILP